MSGPRRRRRWSTEQVRAAMWFWPLVAAAAALPVTLVLLPVRPTPDSALAEWAFAGDLSAASSLLQTVATVAMTVASLTFSLTVVALQLASQQFSPRLLRSFARDWVAQATLGLLAATVVVALTTMRGLDPERPLPVLALLLTLVLGLSNAPVLVLFVANVVRRLRVDTMMASVHHDTRSNLEASYAPYGEGPPYPEDDLPGPAGGVLVPAARSGFVRTVDPSAVADAARRHGVFLLLGVRPGDSVVDGSPVATVFGDGVEVAALSRDLAEAVAFGFERTEEQDVGFGLRQLVDIAVKAISPAINDPTTAAESLSYCGDLLVRLTGRRLGPQVVRDEDGRPRAVLPDRDLRFYLDLVCGQVRRFGRDEPTVLTALLRVLRDTATAARDEDQRAEVAAQVRLVLADLSDRLLAEDAAAVHDLARRVELALQGDVAAAYRDRAGETRTI